MFECRYNEQLSFFFSLFFPARAQQLFRSINVDVYFSSVKYRQMESFIKIMNKVEEMLDVRLAEKDGAMRGSSTG